MPPAEGNDVGCSSIPEARSKGIAVNVQRQTIVDAGGGCDGMKGTKEAK
jgi:hypothetical protein